MLLADFTFPQSKESPYYIGLSTMFWVSNVWLRLPWPREVGDFPLIVLGFG